MEDRLSSPIFLIGKVTQVNSEFHVIKFTVDNYIENATAYPLMSFDEPVVDDEIFLFELDNLFKSVYFYVKKKNDDYIRMRFQEKSISILSDRVEIITQGNTLVLKDDQSVELSNSSGASLTMDSFGNVVLNGTTSIKVGSSAVLKLVNETFLALFNAHVHTGVITGPSSSGPPATPMTPTNLTTKTTAE